MRRLQLHTSRTTAASSGDCLLLPTAGGLLRLNPGKIGLLVQTVRKVTSAPAHFWDRGARWFVVRLYGLGQLVTSCSIFSGEICWLFETRPALMSCQENVLPSKAARVYMRRGKNGGHVVDDGSRMSGVNGSRGAS